MRVHRLLSVLAASFAVIVAFAALSLQAPEASAQVPQVAGTSACVDTGTGVANCTITLQSTLTAGQTVTAALPTGASFISCATLSANGSCVVTSPGVITFTCSSVCTAGNQISEAVQGAAATALGQIVSNGVAGAGQSGGNVACLNSVNGQATCTVTLLSTIAAGSGIVATLPTGLTFVGCNAPPVLGSCTTNGNSLVLVCTSGCGGGSQFTEIVLGAAATAMGQAVVTTSTPNALYGNLQTGIATAACVDQGNGEANCTITIQTPLAPGATITFTLPTGDTFISCSSTSGGTCTTTQGQGTATFTCYSICNAGSIFSELLFGTAATANTQTIVATNVGVNGVQNTALNPYNPYYGYSGYSSYNPYIYGLTGSIEGSSCTAAVSGVCTSSPYTSYANAYSSYSPYGAYSPYSSYYGYGYGSYSPYGYGSYSPYGGGYPYSPYYPYYP